MKFTLFGCSLHHINDLPVGDFDIEVKGIPILQIYPFVFTCMPAWRVVCLLIVSSLTHEEKTKFCIFVSLF